MKARDEANAKLIEAKQALTRTSGDRVLDFAHNNVMNLPVGTILKQGAGKDITFGPDWYVYQVENDGTVKVFSLTSGIGVGVNLGIPLYIVHEQTGARLTATEGRAALNALIKKGEAVQLTNGMRLSLPQIAGDITAADEQVKAAQLQLDNANREVRRIENAMGPIAVARLNNNQYLTVYDLYNSYVTSQPDVAKALEGAIRKNIAARVNATLNPKTKITSDSPMVTEILSYEGAMINSAIGLRNIVNLKSEGLVLRALNNTAAVKAQKAKTEPLLAAQAKKQKITTPVATLLTQISYPIVAQVFTSVQSGELPLTTRINGEIGPVNWFQKAWEFI
jgi:hypothetical protein